MIQYIRQLYCLSQKTKEGTISTICLTDITQKSDIQFWKYTNNFNDELRLLSTSFVDLEDQSIKKGIRNAFYGLKMGLIKTKAYNDLQTYLHTSLNRLLLSVR